jgi:hypothetical protein
VPGYFHVGPSGTDPASASIYSTENSEKPHGRHTEEANTRLIPRKPLKCNLRRLVPNGRDFSFSSPGERAR